MTAPPVADPSDAVLVGLSVREPERFAAVFDRHGDEIHRYAARRLGPEIAEDVVAETFLTAFRKRGTYDAARADARPWLYGIATRVIREHRRSEVRRNRALARAPAQPVPEPFDERVAARVTAERLQPRLAAVLAGLPAGHRDVLLLAAWTDLNYEEIAQALGVPVGTVRSRLHRVRKKVRKALDETDPMRSR